jgi:hypothetical protein
VPGDFYRGLGAAIVISTVMWLVLIGLALWAFS